MMILNRWLLPVLAAACAGCTPTITIKNKEAGNGCAIAKLSKDSFEVPHTKDVAVWRIDNQCKDVAVVDIKNFQYDLGDGSGLLCYPAMSCSSVSTPPGQKSLMECKVNADCRRPEPYKYSIYLAHSLEKDPQVIIKRDRPFDQSVCHAIACSGPTLSTGREEAVPKP